MEKKPVPEKRKWTRVSVALPVRYSKADSFFKYARAANASEGGLLICLPEKMGVGEHLALKLFLPIRSGSNMIEAVVQVVWMDIHLRKDWTWDYRTGVRFEDISPRDRTHLKNFLVNLEQEPMYPS
ncbi:MAG TPA: PilZ domain-containing protein [Thermodesulfobacteriota bacterium]|jgi:c-di-GMP-binding flagellar brake protein YcgR|nr:PilZ domain-containing protein [Thermodesulfobacteriota bacterium]